MGTKLDILPRNATPLRTLCLRPIPLTNHFLQPTALKTLTRLLYFLAANEELEVLDVTCRKLSTRTAPHREVPPHRVHQVEVSSLVVKPLLVALHIPPIADLNIQILPGGSSHTHLHGVLPCSLDGLPGIAQATSLQYSVTQTLGQVVSVSSTDGGAFNIQGLSNPAFPTYFWPRTYRGSGNSASLGRPFPITRRRGLRGPPDLVPSHDPIGTPVFAVQSMVDRILSAIDTDTAAPALIALAIAPLRHVAVDSLVQLANPRR